MKLLMMIASILALPHMGHMTNWFAPQNNTLPAYVRQNLTAACSSALNVSVTALNNACYGPLGSGSRFGIPLLNSVCAAQCSAAVSLFNTTSVGPCGGQPISNQYQDARNVSSFVDFYNATTSLLCQAVTVKPWCFNKIFAALKAPNGTFTGC